jgi:hypothetical protein
MNIRKSLSLTILALAVASLPFFARSASAAPIATTGRPQSPAVAQSSLDGSFLIVWAEDRGMGTGLDLYGARANAAGIVAGTEVPILIAAGNQSDPTMAYSRRNNAYLLIYTSDGSPLPPVNPTPGIPIPGGPTATPGFPTPPIPPPPPPPGPQVLAPRFPSGDPIAASAVPIARWIGPGQLLVSTAPASVAASGMSATTGNADQPPPPLPTPIPSTPGVPPTSLPLPTPGGGTATPPLPPPPPGATFTPVPGGPTATPDPNAPPPPPTAGGSRDLWGVWVSVSGYRFTSTFQVVASPADDTYPDLGYVQYPNGDQFALVWREVTGVNAAISVMRLEGMGYYFIPYSKATVLSGGDIGRPSVAGEQTLGEYYVAWAQTPKDNPAREIYGRRLNTNAFPVGPVRELVTGAADQVYPSIASLGSAGGYILTWEERMPGMDPDIRVRRLNRNGVPQGLTTALAGGTAFSFAPDIASSEAASTLLVWLDRNAASDHSILGIEVNRDGRRLSPERTIVRGGAGPGAVTPVVPGPGFPTPPGPPLPTPLPTP